MLLYKSLSLFTILAWLLKPVICCHCSNFCSLPTTQVKVLKESEWGSECSEKVWKNKFLWLFVKILETFWHHMINCHRHVVSSHTKCPFSLQHKVRGRSLGFVGWLSYDEDAGNVEEAAPFANDDGVCLGMFQTYIYSVMEYIRPLFVTQTCGAGMTNLSVFVSSEVVCGSCKLRVSNWSPQTCGWHHCLVTPCLREFCPWHWI